MTLSNFSTSLLGSETPKRVTLSMVSCHYAFISVTQIKKKYYPGKVAARVHAG
jgi:hypothetical protein